MIKMRAPCKTVENDGFAMPEPRYAVGKAMSHTSPSGL